MTCDVFLNDPEAWATVSGCGQQNPPLFKAQPKLSHTALPPQNEPSAMQVANEGLRESKIDRSEIHKASQCPVGHELVRSQLITRIVSQRSTLMLNNRTEKITYIYSLKYFYLHEFLRESPNSSGLELAEVLRRKVKLVQRFLSSSLLNQCLPFAIPLGTKLANAS